MLFRSLIFTFCFYLNTLLHVVFCSPVLVIPGRRALWAAVHSWANVSHWLLRTICGITYEIKHLDQIPHGPLLVACKHQSTWETLAFTLLFDDIAIVLKRELLFIPVIGWAMARAGNIAVARGDGASALRGLIRQAKAAIAEGRSIVIFPEGTRVALGDQRPYQVGTAALYRQLGVPVVPMALNSGLFWGRRQWVKRPGVITLEILPPIEPGLSREAFMEILRDRIESATNRLINIP